MDQRQVTGLARRREVAKESLSPTPSPLPPTPPRGGPADRRRPIGAASRSLISSVAPSEAVTISGSMFGSSVLNCAAAAVNDAFDSMMYGLSGAVAAVPVTIRRTTTQPYLLSFVGIDITYGSPFARTLAASAQVIVS